MNVKSASGQAQFGEHREFNGVKVFSATMVADRDKLGDRITAWMRKHPEYEIREIVVTQSSDEAFHCLAFTVFYWDSSAA